MFGEKKNSLILLGDIWRYIWWYSAPLLVVRTAPVRLSYHVLLVNAKQENKRGFNVFPGRFHLLSIIMQWKSHGFPLVSREMIYTWWVNSRKIFVYDGGYNSPITIQFLSRAQRQLVQKAGPILASDPNQHRQMRHCCGLSLQLLVFPRSMDSSPCLMGMDNMGHMIWIYYVGFHGVEVRSGVYHSISRYNWSIYLDKWGWFP